METLTCNVIRFRSFEICNSLEQTKQLIDPPAVVRLKVLMLSRTRTHYIKCVHLNGNESWTVGEYPVLPKTTQQSPSIPTLKEYSEK